MNSLNRSNPLEARAQRGTGSRAFRSGSPWRSLALGVFLIGASACTLTGEELTPVSVSSTLDTGDPNPSAPDAGSPLDPDLDDACPGETGCCGSDADCAEGQRCASGVCETVSCSGAESVDSCPLPLCPGPNCPDPDDGETNPPEATTCRDGERNGDEADVDCGNACPSRCATSARCGGSMDCVSFNCVEGVCAAASCSDEITNGDETDVDCGGSCDASCSAGQVCAGDSDCAAGLFCPAATGRCTDVSCQDEVLNGDEVLVDCGGGTCPGCPDGTRCESGDDCSSSVCGADGTCAEPSCADGARNQNETDTDCGGDCNAACATGEACALAEDCQSQVCGTAGCDPGIENCCQPPRCDDGVRNGNEPQIDCGSVSACGLCPVGSACDANGQCATNRCDETCQPILPCEDGELSPGESDVDCGGSGTGCQRCDDGLSCDNDSDCDSGNCSLGVCVSCFDSSVNGGETDVDCGGSGTGCQRCGEGQLCAQSSDCATGICGALGRCTVISCDDGIRNGAETDVDCGGDSDCPRCPDRNTCAQASDCQSQSCVGGRCISCFDGLQNGSETDVDCGGNDPLCPACAPGNSCAQDGDCQSGACEGGACCGGSQGDCTRCAERLSPTLNCDTQPAPPGVPAIDGTGIGFCRAFLQCLADNASTCPTRNAPGCSGDNQAEDACPHNDYGGNAGTGLTRANHVLQNAGCQL